MCRLPSASPLVQALCRHNAERQRATWRVIFCPHFRICVRFPAPSARSRTASFFGPLHPATAESLLVRRGVDGDALAMRHATRRGAGAAVASLLVPRGRNDHRRTRLTPAMSFKLAMGQSRPSKQPLGTVSAMVGWESVRVVCFTANVYTSSPKTPDRRTAAAVRASATNSSGSSGSGGLVRARQT